MFKKLQYKFTTSLINNGIIDKDDFEIYRYGFEVLIYFVVNILVALCIGMIFDRVIHTIIFLSCYCTLRQFTGGYHARNHVECTLIFGLMYLITILVANNMDVDKYKYIWILLMIISTFIIYKLAPLDHRNKPISEIEKETYKYNCIKISGYINIVYIASIVFNIFKEYSIFMLFAIVWIGILLVFGFYINNYFR